jgi:hypothetical protein
LRPEKCTGRSRSRRLALLGALLLLGTVLGARSVPLRSLAAAAPQPTPNPFADRLAEPALPDSPTQVDLGRSLYYFHCMPCHGDLGQGLTDEWREVWVEDHQNCWARGCHTGKSELAAFYIPRQIPALSGTPDTLASFASPEQLFLFVRNTQPPQRPAALTDDEYWSLTAFLLAENSRPLDGSEAVIEDPVPAQASAPSTGIILASTLLLCLAIVLMPRAGRRRQRAAH